MKWIRNAIGHDTRCSEASTRRPKNFTSTCFRSLQVHVLISAERSASGSQRTSPVGITAFPRAFDYQCREEFFQEPTCLESGSWCLRQHSSSFLGAHRWSISSRAKLSIHASLQSDFQLATEQRVLAIYFLSHGKSARERQAGATFCALRCDSATKQSIFAWCLCSYMVDHQENDKKSPD